jgi:hypothetical protein
MHKAHGHPFPASKRAEHVQGNRPQLLAGLKTKKLHFYKDNPFNCLSEHVQGSRPQLLLLLAGLKTKKLYFYRDNSFICLFKPTATYLHTAGGQST